MSRGCFGTAASGAVTLFVAGILSLHAPIVLHADPLEALLPDDTDLNDLLSDIPDGFDLFHAGSDAIAALPWFTPEAADRVVDARDHPVAGGSASFPSGIEGLTPVQRLVIEHVADAPTLTGPDTGALRTGYRHGTGDGSPIEGAWYSRMRFSWNDRCAVTIIGDRDVGEPHAVEAASASLALLFDRGRTSLVAGDYRLAWGQGVLVSRYDRSYRSGTDVIASTPVRFENTQFEESRFLRGLVAERQGELVRTRAWVSRRTLAALRDRTGRIVGVDTDGSVTDGQPEVDEVVYGAGIAITPDPGQRLGVAVMSASYDPPLVHRQGEVFDVYREEPDYQYVSLEGAITRGPVRAVGEHVVQNGGEHGTVAGIEALAGAVEMALQAYHASEGFFSLRSGMPASFDTPGNEEGIYTALNVRLSPVTFMTISRESARTVTRTTTYTMPESKTRTHALLEQNWGKGLTGTVTTALNDAVRGEPRRWYCRMGMARTWTPGRRNGWKGSLAWSSGGGEGGFCADSGMTVGTQQLAGKFSMGVFSIPSYVARYYRYDPDVPGRGMSRAVWGKGAVATAVLQGGPCSVRIRWVDSDSMKRDIEGTLQWDVRW